VTSAAKAGIENKLVIAAVNRCATQNQVVPEKVRRFQDYPKSSASQVFKQAVNAAGLHTSIFVFFRRYAAARQVLGIRADREIKGKKWLCCRGDPSLRLNYGSARDDTGED
jgi:hypothetical protein